MAAKTRRHRTRPGNAPIGATGCNVVSLPIEKLKQNAKNSRRHPDEQVALIAANIDKVGFNVPIIIDETDTILSGHGRLAAARSLGLKVVPTIRLEHLDELQKRAFVIAENRLSQLAEWDEKVLSRELDDLLKIDDTLNFDVEIIGFDTAEIDQLLQTDETDTQAPEPAPPEPDSEPVSRTGDMWLLDKHRLICGDAFERSTHARLFDGATAQMVFTDPPYNVQIDQNVSGGGRIRHREFAMASGELSPEEFSAFLSKFLRSTVRHTADGAILFVCMDWRHADVLSQAGRHEGLELKNICVWVKPNAGMGSFYRSQHEFVLVFKNGTAKHINNFGLGGGGRYRPNVWRYAGVNSWGAERMQQLAMHPTVKPVAMIADAIRDCSRRGGIIFDPFAGSGSTIIAADRTGRRAYALEIDPIYVDVAVRRWESETGKRALLADDGRSFSEIQNDRLNIGGDHD